MIEIAYSIIAIIASGLITWGAIRQDIKNIHANIADIKHSVDQAHERIDSILLSDRPK